MNIGAVGYQEMFVNEVLWSSTLGCTKNSVKQSILGKNTLWVTRHLGEKALWVTRQSG